MTGTPQQELSHGTTAQGSQTGKVNWFNNEKGWGFLTPDLEGSKDVFVHFSGITLGKHSRARRTLQEGASVTFDVVQDAKGKPTAVNVVVIAPSPAVSATA